MNKEDSLQLFKFAAVGCVNTFIDWAVYFTLVIIFPGESALFYAVAKGFSYFCGIVNSFFLNRCWTFRAGKEDQYEGGRFIKFVLVNAVGLGINSLTIYEFLHFGASHKLSLLLATAIAFFFNFTLSKVWVFRKGKIVVKTSGG